MRLFSFRPLVLAVGLTLPLISVAITGCGGGGGGPSKPRPTPTSTPLPVPGNCTATSYSPNYVSNITLQHWPGFPLRIYLNATDARTRALTLRGFDQWVTATGNRVTYSLVNSADQADIVVKFALLQPGSETLGVTTTYYYQGESTIQNAEIQFYYYPTDANIQDVDKVNQSVAAHEFGHALGIAGHSPNTADLMYPRATGGLENITSRDLNTLRTAYCDNFPTRTAGSTPRKGGVLLKRVISFAVNKNGAN